MLKMVRLSLQSKGMVDHSQHIRVVAHPLKWLGGSRITSKIMFLEVVGPSLHFDEVVGPYPQDIKIFFYFLFFELLIV